MSVFLLVAFFGLSMLGVPLAVALALASVATLTLFTSMPLDLLSQTMFSSMNSFLLVAVPLFILVGTVMERGRVALAMSTSSRRSYFPAFPVPLSQISPPSAPLRSGRWSGTAFPRAMRSA